MRHFECSATIFGTPLHDGLNRQPHAPVSQILNPLLTFFGIASGFQC